jgi:hypothetical protein
MQFKYPVGWRKIKLFIICRNTNWTQKLIVQDFWVFELTLMCISQWCFMSYKTTFQKLIIYKMIFFLIFHIMLWSWMNINENQSSNQEWTIHWRSWQHWVHKTQDDKQNTTQKTKKMRNTNPAKKRGLNQWYLVTHKHLVVYFA